MGRSGQVHRIGRIAIPDGYTATGLPTDTPSKYDVAVLKLASGTQVTGITPVQPPPSTENSGEQPGRKLWIAGWGNTTSTGNPANSMQQATVPVVSDADGAKSYPKTFVPELMIAAGGNGTDTCPGDSSGPLFQRYVTFGKAPPGSPPRQPPPPVQYGITAFGGTQAQPCGGAKPGAYTEVNAPP